MLKEWLSVAVYLLLISVVLIPVCLPFIVLNIFGFFLSVPFFIIAFWYICYMWKKGYNSLNRALSNSVIFEWLAEENADLFYMIEEKRKIKPNSPQKKVCIKYIDSEFETIKKSNDQLKFEIDDILESTKKRIRNSEEIDDMIDAGKSHASIAYRVAEYSCRWKLISGELHVYRGVFGMGAGGYMALWEVLLNRLATVDGLSQDDIELKRRNLREAISQAG